MDMSKLADEIIRDLCEKPVPGLERLHLHDALTQCEAELSTDAEGRGFNEARLAEAIVDRPDVYPDPIPARIAALAKRYGYQDE
jgi:hypothetical protein